MHFAKIIYHDSKNYLAVVKQISNTSIEVLIGWNMSPTEHAGIKGIHVHSTDLKRSVYIQVFVELWDLSFNETIRTVKHRWASIICFIHTSSFTQINQSNGLKLKGYI